MCDICVMNSVKNRMLSRRSFFQAGAMATTAAALGSVAAAPPALAVGHGQIVEITHAFNDAFPTWDGAPGIAIDSQASFANDGFNLNRVTVNEHAGTHNGAPKVTGGTGGQARIFAMV